MSKSSSAIPRLRRSLLTGSQVEAHFKNADSNYGRGFTAAEWNEIAERLSALTRLFWRVRSRQLANSPAPPPKVGSAGSRKAEQANASPATVNCYANEKY